MPESSRIAEIIEASTPSFVAQCYELYAIPPLGTLVKTGEPSTEIYAVVSGASTSSIEPGRRPVARGKNEPSEEAIYKSSPQLLKLLRSEFTALIVGLKKGSEINWYLSPVPARIHSFVYACSAEEVRQFSGSFRFLNTILTARLEVPAEEVIAACLRQMAEVQPDCHAFLVAAGKELAVLLGKDYARLKATLGRLK